MTMLRLQFKIVICLTKVTFMRWWLSGLLFSSVLLASGVQASSKAPIQVTSVPTVTSSENTPRSPPALNAHPPAEANKVLPNSNVPIEEKPVDWFARIAASIGIFLGVVNFAFAYWKLRRDRRLSVEDDFWFRKIVAPATIEPLLKGVIELLQGMPTVESSEEELADYARKITVKFQTIYPTMQMLGLVDQSWPEIVTQKLRSCEDALTDHIGSISDKDQSSRLGSTELQQLVLGRLNEALHSIKDGHLKK